MTFAKCDGHDLAVTLSSDLRAWRDEIALALLGCGHRVPEVAVAKCRVLRIGQGRQTRQVLDQPGGRFGTGRVARPRIVARSVRITGPGKIGPGVDKLIGQYRLLAVQRMGNAQWSAMPEREQVLDIGGMIGQRLHSRHIREVERRRRIGELISIDRDLRSEDFIESSLQIPESVPTRSQANCGLLKALTG
jgi:hypothetical protein